MVDILLTNSSTKLLNLRNLASLGSCGFYWWVSFGSPGGGRPRLSLVTVFAPKMQGNDIREEQSMEGSRVFPPQLPRAQSLRGWRLRTKELSITWISSWVWVTCSFYLCLPFLNPPKGSGLVSLSFSVIRDPVGPSVPLSHLWSLMLSWQLNKLIDAKSLEQCFIQYTLRAK